MTDKEKFIALRQYVFDKIKKALEEDGHHKMYEGAFTVSTHWPNYFENESSMYVELTLDCYLLGPTRHYSWTGKTLREAIDKADKEIRGWKN
jgi:hypothetical protein